jgi:GTPase SAR1 family protein
MARLRGIRRALTDTIGQRPGARLHAQWREWDAQLERIAGETAQHPEVAIALVGGTGAGKSTLVNALLEERLLPVSNSRACTAAISQVAYAEDSRYTAEIVFVPRASWEGEIGALLDDLRDQQRAEDGGDTAVTGAIPTIPQAARDKLRAVYSGRDADGAPQDAPWHTLDTRQLREWEPVEIARALDVGREAISVGTIEEFRKALDLYLNSKHRFWPIVKTVRISGPFDVLRGGAVLIDLPGINDPNEAREEVTKRYLKECRYVWIVFNIKRALTKDLISLMQSDDFLRQIVLDGRENALTFVGTASDDIDLDAGSEESGLDEESDATTIILARNSGVRVEVANQLTELAERLATAAQAGPQRAADLASTFRASTIFTVSAREYLRLRGVSRARNGVLDTLEQTELPILRRHMETICAGYGIEAQSRAHHRRLDLLLAEIERVVRVQERALKIMNEQTEQERKEAETAGQAAATFLDQQLASTTDRFRQSLAANQDLLGERMKLATERARYALDQTTARWGAMHWCTVRAVVRRDGVYAGTTGRHDFARDIAEPILNAITFTWADFFGDRLGQLLDDGSDRLLRASVDYGRDLTGRLAQLDRGHGRTDDESIAALRRILDGTEQVLGEYVGQSKGTMRRKIDEVRRGLYEEIPRQIQGNMRRAFGQAAEEHGAGMKRRMVDTLATHARTVSAEMFRDAEEAIMDGVRALHHTLARQYDEMATTVRDHARIGSAGATAGIGELSASVLAQEQGVLDELAEIVATWRSLSNAEEGVVDR